MKMCLGLVFSACIAHAFSHLSLEPSFLGVGSTLGLNDPGIVKTPRGLPLEGNDDHALADPKHEGRSGQEAAHEHAAAHEEHHEEAPAADHIPHHGDEEHHEEHHAEHGHHGEEGEHAEHGEEPHHLASLSLAYFLMGGIGALMIVFHFACSRDPNVKASTWRVLNMTVSIFVAVLLYGTLKGWIVRTFQPNHLQLTLTVLSIFVVLFVATHAVLFRLKGGDETQLVAFSTILAHICGFAAMYGFADSQETHTVEELGGTGIVAVIFATAIVIAALSFAMDKVMGRVAGGDGRVDEDEKKWMEACEETDDDVFCLAVSFLIVLWFRFLIRGKPQPYEPGLAGNVTQSDADAMMRCSLGSFLIVFLGAVAMMKLGSRIRPESFAHRATSVIQHLNSMITAWCFLFWAEWQLYVWGWESTVIGGCLVVAIGMTLFGFAFVLVLNYIERYFRADRMMRRAMNSLEMALGVLVGFSWERAFDVGFEEIEHEYHHSAFGPVLIVGMSLGLFAIVGPAWRLHILPKSLSLDAQVNGEREGSVSSKA